MPKTSFGKKLLSTMMGNGREQGKLIAHTTKGDTGNHYTIRNDFAELKDCIEMGGLPGGLPELYNYSEFKARL